MRVLERRRKKLFHERKTGRFDAICEQGHVSPLAYVGCVRMGGEGKKESCKGIIWEMSVGLLKKETAPKKRKGKGVPVKYSFSSLSLFPVIV